MIIATWPEKVNSNGTGFSNVWKSERALHAATLCLGFHIGPSERPFVKLGLLFK